MTTKIIAIFLILISISSCYGSSELEFISKNAVELHSSGLYSKWKELIDENIVIESMGKLYHGIKEAETYLKHLDIQSSKVKILTPINVQNNYVSFAKEVDGKFNNGCSFSISNIIQIIHFNENLKIDKWVEHWPSNFKESVVCDIKDEL